MDTVALSELAIQEACREAGRVEADDFRESDVIGLLDSVDDL